MRFSIGVKNKKRVSFFAVVLAAAGCAIWARINGGANKNDLLAEAVDNGDAKTVAALLQKGADPNVLATLQDKQVRSEFLEGATDRFPFAEPAAAAFDHQKRESLLWLAAERNHPEIARLLLQHGAKPDTEGNDGETALLNAGYRGNAALVKMLLAAGAKANYQNGAGDTPLLSTVAGSLFNGYHGEGQFPETIRLLIGAGANVNAQPGGNMTPLHYAQINNRGDLAIILSKAGAK